MPMDDPLAYLLPHAPALAAVLVITALPLAAAVLLAPPRRRTVPVVVGLPLLAVLSGLLALAGSRAAAAAVGITAAAVPAAVLIATASGMRLLSLHTGAQLAPLPPGPILAASVCVGLLGVGVWKMAGNYWAGAERVNPAGDRPASSSRSS